MISIIIPVLNEATTIETLLVHIAETASEGNISEILVVDGGSTDNTKDLVIHYSEKSSLKVQLITSEKGRAKQMNIGARNATGTVLYFLHADSFPPKDFDSFIISEVEKGNNAGCFRMKFNTNHPLLQFSQWFTQFNFKFCRGGDQSLFITKNIFRELDGFNESYIIYEDCDIINRLYDTYHFTIIPKYIITSSRKYSQIGTWKLQYHFAIIHLKYKLKASPDALFQYYKKHICNPETINILEVVVNK
jgi:rSAM/selenodomain-associated transferase 2